MQKGKVWLIGGTSDSATIAKILVESKIPLVITVTTATAQALYVDPAEVVVGCMSLIEMRCFCQHHQIKVVVDASHPFATAVSQQAIALTTELNIPYLRYERHHYQPVSVKLQDSEVIEVASFEHLLVGDYFNRSTSLVNCGVQRLT
jgi:precorrin-6A/cobalt-precorrin-6A reductase